MIALYITTFLTLIAGLSEHIVELMKFSNNIEKGLFKRKIRYVSIVVLILTFSFSIYLIYSQNISTLIDKNHADSVYRAETNKRDLQIKGLRSQLNTAKDQLANLDTKARSLLGNQITLLNQEKKNLLKTAHEINKSADTLNKYLAGISGVCYLTLGIISESGFFNIQNPNKYTLQNVNILVMDFEKRDSCISVKNGHKYYNVSKQDSYAIFKNIFQTIGPGTTPVGWKLMPSKFRKRYLIIIELGNEKYEEEFYLQPDAIHYAYRLYAIKGAKRILTRSTHRSDAEWKAVFPPIQDLDNLLLDF